MHHNFNIAYLMTFICKFQPHDFGSTFTTITVNLLLILMEILMKTYNEKTFQQFQTAMLITKVKFQVKKKYILHFVRIS